MISDIVTARRRRSVSRSSTRFAMLGAVLVWAGVGAVALHQAWQSAAAVDAQTLANPSIHAARATPALPAGTMYHSCEVARAAGAAPISSDEPGYNPRLDGDSDGLACEPVRGGMVSDLEWSARRMRRDMGSW